MATPNSVRLGLLADADDWRSESACRDADPGLFFPIGTVGPAIEQIANAKAICAQCPVNVECLEFALTTNQESGIWGGTSEEERRQIRRQWLAKGRVLTSSVTPIVAKPVGPSSTYNCTCKLCGVSFTSANPKVGFCSEEHRTAARQEATAENSRVARARARSSAE